MPSRSDRSDSQRPTDHITPFDTAVSTALQIIGEVLETDRISVHENFDHPTDTSFKYWRTLYDWNSENTIAQVAHPEAGQGSFEPLREWYVRMEHGQSISYLIEEAPEPFRSGQMAIGVKATHVVPISVKDQFWGFLGLDDCREAKQRSAAELSVLKIAADCIGSAIQRERTQQKLLQEKDRVAQDRAQILSTVAQVANLLVRSSDYTAVLLDVVSLLGKAVGSDRCAIVQDVIDGASGKPGLQVPVEWCKAGISYSIEVTTQFESALLWEDLGELHKQFLRGDILHFLVADLPEPSRSIFTAQGNTTMLAVPIVVNACPWGVVSFDNCGEPRLYDQAEIAILQIAADSIAAAIERDRTQKALLQAEQARSQELAKANEALK